MQKAQHEIDKLSITKEFIFLKDIETYIIPEFEESIFVFIDTILAKDTQKIFSEFRNLLDFSNLYALYQSLIANLRIFVYIEYLKSQKKSQSQIADILKLGNRQFLIGKRHASKFKDIQKLYTDLLDFDKNMKF
jgi:DNA polymerase III delta subunit